MRKNAPCLYLNAECIKLAVCLGKLQMGMFFFFFMTVLHFKILWIQTHRSSVRIRHYVVFRTKGKQLIILYFYEINIVFRILPS